MWAAPFPNTFFTHCTTKKSLKSPSFFSGIRARPTGGEDIGFEPQRKQLRQQVGRIHYTTMLKPGSHMSLTYLRWPALWSPVDVNFRPRCIAVVAQMYLDVPPVNLKIALKRQNIRHFGRNELWAIFSLVHRILVHIKRFFPRRFEESPTCLRSWTQVCSHLLNVEILRIHTMTSSQIVGSNPVQAWIFFRLFFATA